MAPQSEKDLLIALRDISRFSAVQIVIQPLCFAPGALPN